MEEQQFKRSLIFIIFIIFILWFFIFSQMEMKGGNGIELVSVP